MARPSKPLISRAAAVRASLEIIEAHGLAGFSVPRLARHLGVRTPSLYYHFTDKSEILAEVARQIAGASVVRPPQLPGSDWPEYFVSLVANLRRAVLCHPNAVALLLHYPPRDFLLGGFEDATRYLHESGVPDRLHMRILDGLETLSLGAVLSEAVARPKSGGAVFPDVDPARAPVLAEALAANDLSAAQLFEVNIRSFLHGVLSVDDGTR